MRKLIPLIIISFLLTPLLALADGMLMPPYGYSVREAEQKAVIFYEDETKTETLILSILFEGDAEDFAWVVPTPTQPEVDKASRNLFESLEELTAPSYDYYSAPLGLGYMGATENDSQKVEVVERKKVDYYDVATLSADDSSALSNWLNDNGYTYPKKYEYVLNSYIENDWYFVAVKIDTSALDSDASSQLKEGQATPLKLTFTTDNIVYPLKISSVINEEDSLEIPQLQGGIGIPIYTDGVIDKALTIDEKDVLSHSVSQGFIGDSGTIEMWVRLSDYTTVEYGYRELANLASVSDADLFEFRKANERLQFVIYNETGSSFKIYQTDSSLDWTSDWTHLAVTWQGTELPKFYFNGELIKTGPTPQGSISGEMPDFTNANFYLGQRGKSKSTYALNGLIDEARVSNQARTAEEIAASYNEGLGQALEADSSTAFLMHFDSDLVIYDKDGEAASSASLRRLTNLTTTPTITKKTDESVDVLLYVFAENKQEISGFRTVYANKIKKKDIKELAQDDNGNPWIEPENGKYFITRLSDSMKPSEMTEDLFPRDADNNSKVGVESPRWIEGALTILWVVLMVAFYFTGIVFFGVFSPFGLVYIGGTLLRLKKESHAAQVIGRIMQLLIVAVYSISIFIIVGFSFYSYYSTDYYGGDFWNIIPGAGVWVTLLAVIPILLLVAVMIIIMIKQERGLTKKKPKLLNKK